MGVGRGYVCSRRSACMRLMCVCTRLHACMRGAELGVAARMWVGVHTPPACPGGEGMPLCMPRGGTGIHALHACPSSLRGGLDANMRAPGGVLNLAQSADITNIPASHALHAISPPHFGLCPLDHLTGSTAPPYIVSSVRCEQLAGAGYGCGGQPSLQASPQ